jgi:4-hydroxy-3-methylbut-2-enyl diphosphate reductase
VAREQNVAAYLIDDAHQVDPEWLKGVETVGLTAGASAPEYLVQNVAQRLKKENNATIQDVFVREENVVFSLPKELMTPASR